MIRYEDRPSAPRADIGGCAAHNVALRAAQRRAGSDFSLTSGDTKVDLTNFTIGPGTSKLYGDVAVNGTVAAKQSCIFNLDGTTLRPLAKSGDTAILEGTRVLVSDTAAGLLNKTFKTDAVKADVLVGIAKITVNTK